MYARVAVARPLRDVLTYAVPPAVELRVGHVVLVPLGRAGETGYVVELIDEPDFDPSKVRPVSRLLDPEPAFDLRQLRFFRWIAAYYQAPLGAVIRTAVPSTMRAAVVSVLQPTEDAAEALAAGAIDDDAMAVVVREVVSARELTRRSLARRLSQELDAAAVRKATDRALRRGLLAHGEREIKESRGRVKTVERVAGVAVSARLGSRMAAVLAMLEEADGPLDRAAVITAHGGGARDALKRLEGLGLVAAGEREDRDVLASHGAVAPTVPPALNADQLAALAALTAEGAEGAFLLFGVTGSGKTEVFLHAAAHARAAGRQVLVLVPEIGLTPQLVDRFRGRFGDGVAVLHSGLTGAERLAEWRRLRAGEADIAVGARSALFAPFTQLGLVVVDEEHDDSYKQDDGVRYNARDLAVVLGREHACPVVLASATPSLESWWNGERGAYTTLRLPHRATPRPVPRVELVDMTQLDTPAGEPSPVLAPGVVTALRETFAAGGQAIVLYNRRGYATMVECRTCGGTYECPSCGITMTLHAGARVVACHYCGLKRPFTGQCPACRGRDLERLGKGTERVAESLAALFADVSIARMDADTTSVRGAHHRILERFRRGEDRLLVGTQIVAKGHDFPSVHTAVVVSADRGFRMPDFRAAERTYALIVQLAGRAGRGQVAGRVLVQTWAPDHYVLQHLDDVPAFLRAEARIRQTLRYPPFSRLCLVRLEGVDRERVRRVSSSLAADLRSRLLPGVDVLGPAAAALPRMVGRWRYQVIIRGSRTADYLRFLRRERSAIEALGRGGVRVVMDVDPRHLL
jgi:primosomal protein N' (replication factor Y)